MKILDNIIFFKSANAFFQKEITGIKPNTVRVVSPDLDLNNVEFINLTNSKKEFTREISDISKIGDVLGKDIIVISWNHVEGAFP